MTEPNSCAVESPSVPPLFSRNHFSPHSVKFSAPDGETGTGAPASMTGASVVMGTAPSHCEGAARCIPLALKVLRSAAASVFPVRVTSRRKVATSAGAVSGLGISIVESDAPHECAKSSKKIDGVRSSRATAVTSSDSEARVIAT